MDGNKLVKDNGDNIPDRFDPETGKPLARAAEEAEPADLFDPMTGKPLARVNEEAEPADLFDPMTGKPIGQKKKLRTVLIGGAACICIVAVGAAAWSMGLFKNSRDIVADALTEIIEAADEGFIEDTFGMTDIRKLVESGNIKMGGAFSLEKFEEESSLEGSGFSLDFSRDTGNRSVLVTAGAEYRDMKIGRLDLFLDSKSLMLEIPQISDSVFTLNYADNLEEQVDKSPYLSEALGLSEGDGKIVGEFLTDTNQVITGEKPLFRADEIIERYKTLTKATETLKAAMEIEKIDSKKFTINGGKQSCKGYQVVIPKKAIAEFIKTTGKFITSDEQLKEQEIAYLMDIVKIVCMASGRRQEDAARLTEQFQSELIDALKDGTDSAVQFVKDNMDDIELTLYVDKKGHAAYLEAGTSIDAYTSVNIETELTFKGGASLFQNLDGSIKFTGGGDSVKILVEKSGKESKNVYSSEMTAKLKTNYGEMELKMDGEYNKKNGSFTVDMRGISGAEKIRVLAEGTVSDLKKGKSFSTDIETLRFEAPYSDAVELNGRLYIEQLSENPSAPEGENFDIISSKQEDWEDRGKEIKSNIRSIVEMLSAL